MLLFKKIPSEKLILTIGLFLIGTIHTMIFGIFQVPENFLMGRTSLKLAFVCKVILYGCAIVVSLCHQIMCRYLGLRKALYFGLLCNLFGLITLFINQVQGKEGLYSLIYVDMFLFGLALTSVINALVTYLIIEFPKYLGVAVVILFAFFNIGAMLAPLFDPIEPEINYIVLSLLMLICIWFVHVFFFEPPKAKKIQHIRKGSVMWKEMHYRLGLFVLANTAYALAEATFSLWGYKKIASVFGAHVADEIVPFFWMFMILGQFVLLIPLYFLSAKKVFFFLIFVVMTASFMFPLQTHVIGFIGWIAIAGFGCSAVFPILLSQMEKEMFPFVQGKRVLPYIEKSISLLFAGYFAGVGFIDLWVLVRGHSPLFSLSSYFHLAAIFIAISALVTLFLDLTTPEPK